MAGYGSALEVRKDWTLDMLADSHELLDMREDAERQAHAEAMRQQGGR